MPRVTIERERCKGCSLCVEACPQDVLAMSREINAKGYYFAHKARPWDCLGCRLCAITCPDLAIEIALSGAQYHPFEY